MCGVRNETASGVCVIHVIVTRVGPCLYGNGRTLVRCVLSSLLFTMLFTLYSCVLHIGMRCRCAMDMARAATAREAARAEGLCESYFLERLQRTQGVLAGKRRVQPYMHMHMLYMFLRHPHA